VNEAVNDDIAQSYGGVVHVVFHDNMFSGLDLSFITWAADEEVREEFLSVFSNRGMSSSHMGETST